MQELAYIMAQDKEKNYKKLRQIGLFTTIPAILLVGPALGYFIGNFLDSYFRTSPWLMIFFMIIGAVASVKEIIKFISKGINNNDD